MARRRSPEGREGRMALGSRVRTDCLPSLAQVSLPNSLGQLPASLHGLPRSLSLKSSRRSKPIPWVGPVANGPRIVVKQEVGVNLNHSDTINARIAEGRLRAARCRQES